MTGSLNIQYLQRSELSNDLWNRCIERSSNTLVYAQTWYLDAMCDHWDALVLNNYEAVMPLPWRKKWGIRYLYTPYFVPVLNIFSKKGVAVNHNAFLLELKRHFRYGTFDADYIPDGPLPQGWQQAVRTNFILSNGPLHYSRLATRKLAQAIKEQVTIEQDVAPDKVIRSYQQMYWATHAEIPAASYERLIAACKRAPREQIVTLAAHLPDHPFAGFYLLLTDHQNLYSLLGGSTPAGKKKGAFYALTNAAVNLAMQQGKTFRFEGSDLAGIAFFNRQFGPHEKSYTQLRLNRLPWPIKLWKP